MTSVLLWLTLALVGLGGCAGGGQEGPILSAVGVKPWLEVSTDRVRLPFPTRYLTRPDARTASGDRLFLSNDLPAEVDAALQAVQETDLVGSVSDLDGFSCQSPVLIPFSGPLAISAWDQDALGEPQRPGQGFARLYDITNPNRPEPIDLCLSFIEGQNVLVLRPGRPLAGGHRILACLVGPFTDQAGRPVSRPPLFDAVLKRAPGLPSGPLIQDLEEVRDLLHSGCLPVSAQDVLLAFSYWTNSKTGELEAIRQTVAGLDATSPIVPEQVTFKSPFTVIGKLRSPDLRIEGRIPEVPAGELPRIQAFNRIDFLLRLPFSSRQGVKPLVFLHGLDDSRRDAPRLPGFGVFAIDALYHGDRKEEPSPGPFPFIDPMHPARMRDNIRQTVADHMALVWMISHLIENPEAFGLPDGLLASAPLSLYGGSLGGINGAVLAAADPRLDHVVCAAAGGLLSELLLRSVYGFFLPAALRGLAPFERLICLHLIQAVLDAADPAIMAPGLILAPPEGRPPRNVLMALVVGDRSVPNLSTEALAASAGLAMAQPAPRNVFGLPELALPIEGNIRIGDLVKTGVLVEYELDVSPVDRHQTMLESTSLRKLSLGFLQSAAANGVGRVLVPEEP